MWTDGERYEGHERWAPKWMFPLNRRQASLECMTQSALTLQVEY